MIQNPLKLVDNYIITMIQYSKKGDSYDKIGYISWL